jgi:hypothetical protein
VTASPLQRTVFGLMANMSMHDKVVLLHSARRVSRWLSELKE